MSSNKWVTTGKGLRTLAGAAPSPQLSSESKDLTSAGRLEDNVVCSRSSIHRTLPGLQRLLCDFEMLSSALDWVLSTEHNVPWRTRQDESHMLVLAAWRTDSPMSPRCSPHPTHCKLKSFSMETTQMSLLWRNNNHCYGLLNVEYGLWRGTSWNSLPASDNISKMVKKCLLHRIVRKSKWNAR